MRHYILLQLIHGSGGVQCYVAAKAKWLEDNGWHVVVISSCHPQTKQKCLIASLNKYISQGNVFTRFHPHELPKCIVKKQLRKMIKTIGPIKAGEDAIVESWDCETALWGELLSSRIHGRHLFWTANEIFRGDKKYAEKMDYFKFKMDRGEILTDITTVNYLFEGYYTYKESDFIPFIETEDPIQDVKYEQVDTLQKKDWNICYIGRDKKPYVPNVFKGVEEFSKMHLNKQVQFIVVGKVIEQRALLDSISSPNLSIVELGDLYPLPRQLYQKIDVIIAGSGAARHSVDEGALVISTDTNTLQSHGLLGYDTQSSIYSETNEPNYSFAEALERALVTQDWHKKDLVWTKMPGVGETMEIQDKIVSKASPDLKYYDEIKLLQGDKKYFLFIKTVVKIYLYNLLIR